MSTSGSYSFSVTSTDIVRQAMMNIVHFGDNEAPSPSETYDAMVRLNMLCKQWMGKADFAPGLKTWTRRTGYLFLSGSTGTYQVGPNTGHWTNSFVSPWTAQYHNSGATTIYVTSVTGIHVGDNFAVQMNATTTSNSDYFWSIVTAVNTSTLAVTINSGLPSSSSAGSNVFAYTTNAQILLEVEAANLRDQNGEDVAMTLMTLPQYASLPSRMDPSNVSDPTGIYIERQLGYNNIFTDVASTNDITKYLVINYMEPIQDFVNPADNPCYPQEWYLALVWGLTKELCPMYGGAWTALMAKNYEESITIAQSLNPIKITDFFQCKDD